MSAMTGPDCKNPTTHSFGHWRFDTVTGDLFDGTTTLRLEPQVARLLDYFLTHQNTLITRDQLIAEVWDERVVTDDAANRCISILRQLLTPQDRNAYIETVVRRGFISHFPPPVPEKVPVKIAPPAEEKAAGIQPRKHNYFWLSGIFAGVTALLALIVLQILDRSAESAAGTTPDAIPMIAVLPFVSIGTGADSDFLARGVQDDLITQLAQFESIRVISRASASNYHSSESQISEIGRELGADAVLKGGVQRVGDKLRINVQLIDAHTNVHLWARRYDRALTPTNIFSIQSEIASSVASALNATLTRQDVAGLNVLPTENMAAYRAYHEAMEIIRPARTIADPAYLAAMERAVELDPGFVRAWAEVAGSLSFLNISRQDPASIQRLEKVLETIRSLAPQSSEYLIAQSYYTYYILKDYERAYDLISRARSLRPSDVQVVELQSWIQRRLGDFDGMIESIRQARSLSPGSEYWTLRLVSNLMLTHRYNEADELLRDIRVKNFKLAELHSMLRVRDHRDPARMLPELLALEREHAEETVPIRRWEAHIAARDYAGATTFLDAFHAAGISREDWSFQGLPDHHLARIITSRLQGRVEEMATSFAVARERIEEQREAGVIDFDGNFFLAMALVSAAEGIAEETGQLVRTWRRKATHDLAELSNQRHYACRALAMSGVVPATLECLRSALTEPSWAMPFIEPFLPYYDSMREDPGFLALFADSGIR